MYTLYLNSSLDSRLHTLLHVILHLGIIMVHVYIVKHHCRWCSGDIHMLTMVMSCYQAIIMNTGAVIEP